MKSVKITYYCDYCKHPINTDDDAVCVLLPGRIGYQDSLAMDPEDEAHHYHDTCMEYLLCLTASNDNNLGSKEKEAVIAKAPDPEVIAEHEPEQKNKKKICRHCRHSLTPDVHRGGAPPNSECQKARSTTG